MAHSNWVTEEGVREALLTKKKKKKHWCGKQEGMVHHPGSSNIEKLLLLGLEERLWGLSCTKWAVWRQPAFSREIEPTSRDPEETELWNQYSNLSVDAPILQAQSETKRQESPLMQSLQAASRSTGLGSEG